MIYTVGIKSVYDKYIQEDPDAGKAKGGSVWRDGLDALLYLAGYGILKDFDVYGVDADWDKDAYEEDGYFYLNREAKLVKLEDKDDKVGQ